MPWGRHWPCFHYGAASHLSRLEQVARAVERQLSVGGHLAHLVLQQARDVGVGDAVVVAAEADVVLLQLDGPEGGVELAVLVLSVGVDAPRHTHEHHQHHDDDCQHDDVELRPGDVGSRGRRAVGGGTGQAGD